jgi:hypothetical protein
MIVGERVRYAATKEEGVVVSVPENDVCVLVRFGGSFDYVIPTNSLERVGIATWGYRRLGSVETLRLTRKDSIGSSKS